MGRSYDRANGGSGGKYGLTRTGASRQVDGAYAFGRQCKALAFHEVARLALERMDRVRDPDAVSLNAILAAIADTNALTAAFHGRVNQKDHAAAVKPLRDALGKALPDAQERRLTRQLGRKAEVQYGSRQARGEDAGETVATLDTFAAWAMEKLAERSVAVSMFARPGEAD
jgi:hypothetical protein